MESSALPDSLWSQLSDRIAEAMGLHFPRERWPDLQRNLAEAAEELGFADVAACAAWLLSAPQTKAQLQVLASHLTIGETYFFREKHTFEVFADQLLPALIQSRRGGEQRLRIWSAACSTGEEAYSLAILLRQVLPDFKDWAVTILGTDINPHAIRKAVAGSYGEWSFRNAPEGFKERYFNRSAEGRYVVVPEIKQMVTFEHLNLVEDGYPSLTTNTNAMDLIFCRNVLMYFTPEQTRNVIEKLHHAMLEGAWLAVSPCEVSQELFPQFAARNFPGVVLYQKSGAETPRDEPSPQESPPVRPVRPVRTKPRPPTLAAAALFYQQGRYAEAVDLLRPMAAARTAAPPVFSLLARALVNQGDFAEALAWCNRWIAADKLDSAGHYVRAVILLEQGEEEESRRSLQRAVYLHHDFVLAHFTLGTLARGGARNDEAARHFNNALNLLARLAPDDLLPESDGLSAGWLTETITALTALETIR